MPKPKDPIRRALDGVLRALDPLTPDQRGQAMTTVRYILERSGTGRLTEPKKARVPKKPAAPPPMPEGPANG